MVEMMSSCTQLYELILYSSRLFSLGPHDLEQIESLVTSSSWKIRSLRLMECSSQSPILYELLSVFPDVQFLVLGIELSAAPPLWTPAVELYELKLHRTLPSEVLVWLLSSSRQSLRILELRDLPSASTALDLVPCFPNLQSLRLMRFNSHSAAILLQCANLVELVLLNVPTIFPLPPLPASLQHLYLPIQTYSTGIDIESVLRAVNSDNLPNLRILSFTGASDQASPLQAACLSKNINFRASPSKSWTNDDPVKTLHFPRRKSISNFLLMR
ncbi:unnamed protein product [Mycena citricolor]|uniref:Uncharacterized protein n=1 Tax=Mycena citricolor TaxID=2018698 RepID=A0AAD2HYG9_9AGAR|nr:unnamed protein product [Mycena citricolor]